MPRSADESQDDSENDDATAPRSTSLNARKMEEGEEESEKQGAVRGNGGGDHANDVPLAESDATGNEHLGFRSDNSESDRTPGAGYHNIATLGEDINLLDYVREHNTTLTFPEKLMLTLTYVERECAKMGKSENSASIGWVLDGKAFVVRNNSKLYSSWLPLFFGQSKFSSFTRKLYRWGFRKINLAPQSAGGTNANTFFFGNENFQRDKKELLSNMKSVTAAKTRCELASDAAKNGWLPPNQENATAPSAVAQASTTAALAFPTNVTLPQMAVPAGTIDQASLIQQAMNLAALQTLLAAPQAALQGQVTLPQPQANSATGTANAAAAAVPNQYLDENALRMVAAAPQQQPAQAAPQVPQLDYNQMLSQLAFSAAFAAASGSLQPQLQQAPQGQAQNVVLAQPQAMVQQVQAAPQVQQATSQPLQAQQTQAMPWWASTTATGQPAMPNVLSQPAVQEWRPPAQPDAGAQQAAMPNNLDPAQIRGMLDMVLRYGQAQQQQLQQPPAQQQQPYQQPQQILQQPQQQMLQQQMQMNNPQQQQLSLPLPNVSQNNGQSQQQPPQPPNGSY